MSNTKRHLTTRIDEHKKANSLLEQCRLEGESAVISGESTDRTNNETKLLTLDVIHNMKEKPRAYTGAMQSGRELILKV